MTTEEAFLQAVCASPDDDAPRLIYADWLEERGGKPGAARAEFIRVSCQLARLPAQDPGRARLQSRQRQLLDAHCKKWARPFIGKVLSFEFLRGFVERIETDGKAFLRNAAKWLSLSPLRHIAVRDVGPFAVPLLDSLRPARVLTLNIWWGDFGANEARALAASPHLSGLTTLALQTTGLTDAGAVVLAGAKVLRNLQRLNLPHSGLTPSGVEALARSRHLARLASLDLSRNHLGDAGARALASSGSGTPIAELALWETELTAEGVGALASCPRLARLSKLYLAENAVGAAGIRHLARAPFAATLTALELRDTGAGNAGAEVLAASSFPNLTDLGLGDNDIGDAGARALAKSRLLAPVGLLDLSENRIGDTGGRALCASPHLDRVERLNLSQNRLGKEVKQMFRDRFGRRVTFSN